MTDLEILQLQWTFTDTDGSWILMQIHQCSISSPCFHVASIVLRDSKPSVEDFITNSVLVNQGFSLQLPVLLRLHWGLGSCRNEKFPSAVSESSNHSSWRYLQATRRNNSRMKSRITTTLERFLSNRLYLGSHVS